MPLFASIAAVGAGLHVAGYWIEGEATISEASAVAATAIPVAAYILLVFANYAVLHRGGSSGNRLFHGLLLVGTMLVIAAAIGLAVAGVSLGICLLVVMLGPFVTVVGFELIGYRHLAADRRALLGAE